MRLRTRRRINLIIIAKECPVNTVQIFQAACKIEWGTVPQWLTFIGVAVGFYIAVKQLQHHRSVRETENIIRVSDSTVAHNSYFRENALAAKAVQMLEGLNVPESDSAAARYWATREVHFSHLNLIWRVWELGGRPGHGKAITLGMTDGKDLRARSSRKNCAAPLARSKLAEGLPRTLPQAIFGLAWVPTKLFQLSSSSG
jgi:hypothetical protein